MAHYQTYQSNAAELPLMRKWVIRGLILSLLIHAGLFVFFHFKKLENFGHGGEERLAPPTRVMTRQVVVPEEIPEDTKVTLPTNKPIVPIPLESDKPEVQIVQMAPQIPEMPKPILNEKPQAPGGIDSLATLERNSMGALEKQLSSMVGGTLEKSTRAKGQPVITVPIGRKGDGGQNDMAGIPGRQLSRC